MRSSWSIRPASAAPPARIRRAMSARSTPCASCSPGFPRRASASTPRAPSASTAGNGRCPACGGNGFEHVEMQFLSDVYLRCPDCNGRRYRAEVLECKLPREGFADLSIADVLDLTVSEALEIFKSDSEVCVRLAPLAEVGLDYLRLGQPVPTLSGGEAQRLKLAGHLAESAAQAGSARKRAERTKASAGARRGSLFLFDEPTTGLHFDDVVEAAARFPPAHRCRQLDHRHRAQPGRGARRRLDHRSGSRGRRRRRDAWSAWVRPRTSCASPPRIRDGRSRSPRPPPRSAAAVNEPDARAGALVRTGEHRDPRCARAQSQRHRRQSAAQSIHGHHRRVRKRQEHARVRHPVCRGAAPLSRVAQRLRAAIRAAGLPPRHGCNFRHSSDRGDRAAHQPGRPQEHRGDAHRDLSLPAAAVRKARSSVLPRLPRAHRAAARRRDCRAPPQGVPRPAR